MAKKTVIFGESENGCTICHCEDSELIIPASGWAVCKDKEACKDRYYTNIKDLIKNEQILRKYFKKKDV